jgi:hypothetical protein
LARLLGITPVPALHPAFVTPFREAGALGSWVRCILRLNEITATGREFTFAGGNRLVNLVVVIRRRSGDDVGSKNQSHLAAKTLGG